MNVYDVFFTDVCFVCVCVICYSSNIFLLNKIATIFFFKQKTFSFVVCSSQKKTTISKSFNYNDVKYKTHTIEETYKNNDDDEK